MKKNMNVGYILLTAFLFILLASVGLSAQTKAFDPKQMEAEQAALMNAASTKDPAARTEALIKFVKDYPQSGNIGSLKFYLMMSVRELQGQPEKVRAILNRFVEGTTSAPAYARCQFYTGIAEGLLNSNLLLDMAEDLSRKGVALLDEKAYVEQERRNHEQNQEYRKAKGVSRSPEPFSAEEQVDRFRIFSATQHATLGNICLKRGKIAEAEKSLRQALAIAPVMEGLNGMATIAQKRGDRKAEFDYLTAAILTGRLNRVGRERFAALYRELNPNTSVGLNEYLDAKYREKPHSTLNPEPYKPGALRSDRVVLAELATGADCQPCVAVDQAFDAALERYSRQDLVLLVYHMHAPDTDPMVSPAAVTRHKFYGMRGTPSVVLDGKSLELEGSRKEVDRVFKTLDSAVASRLEVPAKVRIGLKAIPQGPNVRVAVTVDKLKSTSPDLRLHVMLVERELSYSGSNGLRFHPMVVRAMASQVGVEGGGFTLEVSKPSSAECNFDLTNIKAELQKYMTEYLVDINKRMAGLTGKISEAKDDRSTLNPERLAVVAFVQDAKTHEILQAEYVPVKPADTSVAD